MDSIFKKNNKAALQEYILECQKLVQIDTDTAINLTNSTLKYYSSDKKTRIDFRELQDMEKRWYLSLNNSKPDYSIYNEENYLFDLWACWVLYSRKYLLSINSNKSLATKDDHGNWYNYKSIVKDIGMVGSIADLGCGFGYTTAGLKELFPEAFVYGTNLEDSKQYKIATIFGSKYNFSILPTVIKKTELIFASEYFEHFERPIEHLIEIINTATPKFLITANTFNAMSIGHFNVYKHNSESFSGKGISRLFNNTLRNFGYEKVYTKLWNNRPSYWRKLPIMS